MVLLLYAGQRHQYLLASNANTGRTMTLTLRSDDFEAFFAAPFASFGADSPYVSPLKSGLRRFLDRCANPLFQGTDSDISYFTAHRGSRTVGRITAHVHAASNQSHDLRRGYSAISTASMMTRLRGLCWVLPKTGPAGGDWRRLRVTSM